MDFVVGIDVGGYKKGFHGAILDLKNNSFSGLFHEIEAEAVLEQLKDIPGVCRAIAIDCPPKAYIKGPKTRLAERELVRLGYRVQFVSRNGKASEWMLNGSNLWILLKNYMSDVEIIETFPTALSDKLSDIEINIPLKLLAGKDKRKFYGDYIDACLCAIAAKKFLQGKSTEIGKGDELGPIHIL
ncbi:MAG: hypothetical protein FJZ16_02850 [Candidatus Omnitrophica bacterium]|nr:hypothetical protein [Candidatus Omnitrophota bacterium]